VTLGHERAPTPRVAALAFPHTGLPRGAHVRDIPWRSISAAPPLRARAAALRQRLEGEGNRLRLVYFLYFAATGTLQPFLAKYLKGRGFTGGEVGNIQMAPAVVALFAGVVWARIAEKRRDPVRVIGWLTAWAALSALFLPFAATPLAVGAVVFSMSLGDRGLMPLLDSLSLEYVRKRPEVSYSRMRMFGSLGYAVLATALGYVLDARGDRPGDVLVPATIAFFAVCYALAARRLVPEPPAQREHPTWRDLWVLFGDYRLMLVLAAGAIHWVACMPYSLWMGRFVEELGLPAWVAGWAITAGVLAEVTAMMAFPWLERWFSPRALLAVVFLGSAARWALTARTSSAPAIVALQVLHGLSYGLFWATLVKLVTDLVPARMRATGLALCSATVFGVGNMVGSRLVGWGHDQTHSVARLFGWATWPDLAIGAAAVALLAWSAVRAASPPDPGAA
jgi:PPP family 3-phenylpropionic acid transporter